MNNIVFNLNEIVVMLATQYVQWYSGRVKKGLVNLEDKIRGDLALQTVVEAKNKGYKIVVFDASNTDFRKELEILKIEVINERPLGLYAVTKTAFGWASQCNNAIAFCWVQPEKVSFVKDCLENTVRPIVLGEADVVIPTRDKNSFLSYPEYQKQYEIAGNKLWNYLVNMSGLVSRNAVEFDIFFGPIVIANNKKLIEVFRQRHIKVSDKFYSFVRSELCMSDQHLSIIATLRDGYRVISQKVFYVHSLLQTEMEQNSLVFKQKRDMQFKSILTQSLYYLDYLNSIIRSLHKNKKHV